MHCHFLYTRLSHRIPQDFPAVKLCCLLLARATDFWRPPADLWYSQICGIWLCGIVRKPLQQLGEILRASAVRTVCIAGTGTILVHLLNQSKVALSLPSHLVQFCSELWASLRKEKNKACLLTYPPGTSNDTKYFNVSKGFVGEWVTGVVPVGFWCNRVIAEFDCRTAVSSWRILGVPPQLNPSHLPRGVRKGKRKNKKQTLQ